MPSQAEQLIRERLSIEAKQITHHFPWLSDKPYVRPAAGTAIKGAVDQKTIILDGVPTRFLGAVDDLYFKTLPNHAKDLQGLASLVRRLLPPDGTALDIGANIGLSTLLLSRRAKHLVSFEPSPRNADFLQENIRRNHIANTEVHRAAVSDKPGTLRFHVAQLGAWSHVVAPGHLSVGSISAIEVPSLTLDSLDLPPIAFIKIDAEGHEPNVLAGACKLLARDRPWIFMEFNAWCLTGFASHSPGAFAAALWRAFEVWHPVDGALTPLHDPHLFLHNTMVHHASYTDIVLRPRAGVPMPTLPELTWPEAARAALESASTKPPARAPRKAAR